MCEFKEGNRVVYYSEKGEKAILFFKHMESHKEVQEAPIHAGIPVCKICGESAEEILNEQRAETRP